MLPIAPPTIMPNATRTVPDRAAASRKLNQNNTSTTIAIPISTTALLPNRPNAPWTFRSYVQRKKCGMIVRQAGKSGTQCAAIQRLESWSAHSTTIATPAMTSVLTKLEAWLRDKLIKPSCDVEKCIVNENEPYHDHKRTRGEFDRGQRAFDAIEPGEHDSDRGGRCQERQREAEAIEG